MRQWIRHACCLFFLLCWPGALVVAAQPDVSAVAVDIADAVQAESPSSIAVPRLESPVTDLTGTLDSDWVAAMQQRLLDLQQRKGSQIAVLMVPSTGEDSIEQFATRVFEQWRLGRASVDDGVLVLVAKEDRTMRIEVGYGLEGAIPDVAAGRIIRDEMVPAFRQGDFASGIERAVGVLERLIDGETLPDQRRSRGLTWEGWLVLFGLVGGGVAGVALRRRWLGVKVVLSTLAVMAVLMAASAGLKSLPMLLFVIPFIMLLGAGIGVLAAGSRLAAGIAGGFIGYLVVLMISVLHFDGGDVVLYGLVLPIGGCLGLALLCVPFILAHAAWKRSRLEFLIRLVLASGICAFVVTITGIVEHFGEFPESLALLPMLYFPMLFAFIIGGGSSSGSSSSGGGSSSSSSGSGYSGGGGSSGGGGASGNW